MHIICTCSAVPSRSSGSELAQPERKVQRGIARQVCVYSLCLGRFKPRRWASAQSIASSLRQTCIMVSAHVMI